MEYKKNPLTYEEQADLLLSRGLIPDRDVLIKILQNVNYYRLSGYLYAFRNADDSFEEGTSLDIIWRRYRFDRRLRFLLLDAIERVEVGLKSRLIYYFVHQYGAFGYLDIKNLPNLKQNQHDDFIDKLELEISRSKEKFVSHFRMQYSDKHDMPPLWIACELFRFGHLLTFYRGAQKKLKQKLAQDIQIPDIVLFSWLLHLNSVRNLCAHHSRIWDKSFNLKLPNHEAKYPDWFKPIKIDGLKLFGILTVLRYLLSILAPNSQWHKRLYDFLKEYPDIPLKLMGFPENWKKSAFWKDLDFPI